MGDVGGGLVSRFAALGFDDLVKGFIDILGHAFGVAADVEVGAFFQPLPEFAGGLEHAGLDVDFFFLIAAEGGVEAGEVTALHPGDDLIMVEEIRAAFLIAEEEPVFSGGLGGLAFFEEGAERRDASAGADHDDGLREVRGKAEMVRGVEVDAGGLAERQSIREKGAGDALMRDTIGAVAHRTNAEMHFIGMCLDAAGDGVESRLELAQVFEEGRKREASFGCFAEEMTDFEVGEKGLAKGFRAERCRRIE